IQENWPELYRYMLDIFKEVLRLNTTGMLKHNWDDSIFPCTMFNLDPNTMLLAHRNIQNLAFGLCVVHAIGNYNADRGGHLILWDLGLIICFPPGATLIFLSALILYSNTAIQPHKERYSFTQFFAGHLARWAYNG
ncbi:hypothetical protein HDZ31DRAFT_25748, partial [Schizophyllum fasciatum]